MARSRNIKPGICSNEDLAECSVAARFLFAVLPMWADREGRLEDRPKRLRGYIFPYENSCNVDSLLQELATHGSPPFIIRYQNKDGRFIQITGFKDHQSPHYSEKPSVIMPPEFSESAIHDEPNTPGNNESSSNKESENSPVMIPPKNNPTGTVGNSLIPDSHDSPIPDSGFLIPSSPKKPKGANGKKRTDEPPPELPDWLPLTQWNAWITARTKVRHPPTNFALRLAIAKLENFKDQGQNIAAILANAAMHNWSDLYPEQSNGFSH